MITSTKNELSLLLALGRTHITPQSEAEIRSILERGVNWTRFASYATTNGLAALVGQTLIRVADDLVPNEISDAFQAIYEKTKRRNRALFGELVTVIECLGKIEVEVIPFKGPILAIQAFGDLGLRTFGGLDMLVRGRDYTAVVGALRELGYRWITASEDVQNGMADQVRHQEIAFSESTSTPLEIHRQLMPVRSIPEDDAAIWHRAQYTRANGQKLLTLAPDDTFLLLVMHGSDEMWRNIKWICDLAAFIATHKLEWPLIAQRARHCGWLRPVKLALSLAHNHFGSVLPQSIAPTSLDRTIETIGTRIAAGWAVENRMNRDGQVSDKRWLFEETVEPTDYLKKKALSKNSAQPALIPKRPVESPETQWLKKMRIDAERALGEDPKNEIAWRRLSNALFGLELYDEAIAAHDKALAFAPDNVHLWKQRKAALAAIGKKARFPDTAVAPTDANGWALRAGALWFSASFTEASEASDRALELDPAHLAAMRIGINSRMQSCDWRQRDRDKQRMRGGLEQGAFIVRDCGGLCESEEELRMRAQFIASQLPPPETVLWRGERYRHDRIRVAYLSTDFRNHAVASVIVGCFELHDRKRFETTAVSLQASDGSELRKRIEGAFDRFVDASLMSDLAIAEMLRKLEIDIAIDLNGYSGEMRPRILAHRPAPVQASYLGYPGTMQVPFMDYIIADRVVIPEEHQRHYSEKMAYLPHCYMPIDWNRRVTKKTPSRIQAELPEAGFIFACFNDPYKIAPEIFDVWMRLLRGVEGSVLWLSSLYAAAVGNLRGEARARGVAPERLIFAPFMARSEDHLARLRLADLFLDTRPYNAHATASDALWAGLPLVTYIGSAFPGRVAASLLYAAGLPELVTTSIEGYEETARALALNPERVAELKAKLHAARSTKPLFETAGFTLGLESAYTTMWERQQAGLAAQTFAVRL